MGARPGLFELHWSVCECVVVWPLLAKPLGSWTNSTPGGIVWQNGVMRTGDGAELDRKESWPRLRVIGFGSYRK
jgi:hypothetical protein